MALLAGLGLSSYLRRFEPVGLCRFGTFGPVLAHNEVRPGRDRHDSSTCRSCGGMSLYSILVILSIVAVVVVGFFALYSVTLN
jgi:hypothetical protein